MNIVDLDYSFRFGDYQIDNFKDFLKNINFSFVVPSIHVAGTNGKGTTSTYISSIYKEAGLKVGLFLSPYFYEVNEMISINGNLISNEYILDIFNEYKDKIEKFDLSEFEFFTFVALKYFTDSSCDIAVIECGMGGELDATNVFIPILNVITSVSIEHTSYLGRSISEIAYHKSGIMRENIPTVIGKFDEEARRVIYELGNELNSKIIEIVEASQPVLNENGYTFNYLIYKDLSIQSKAYYSVIDACLALDAIHALSEFKSVSLENIQKGLRQVKMPCRMEIYKDKIIVDGAHNPEGISLLKESILKMNLSAPIHAIFACFKDKNMQSMLSELGSFTDTTLLTTFSHPRARTLDDYFLFASDYEYVENPFDAIKMIQEKYPDDYVLVVGSLAFAAHISKGLKEAL